MPPHYGERPDVAALHRAIGQYITAFSEVVVELRRGIGRFLHADEAGEPLWWHPPPQLAVLLDRMTAGPLGSGYFAMSGTVAELSDADRAVRDALLRIYSACVALRNNIAHADWDVGWADATSGEIVVPRAVKTRVSKDGPEPVALAIDASLIAEEALKLHVVTRSIRAFTESCLALRSGDSDARPAVALRIYESVPPAGQWVEPTGNRSADRPGGA